MKRIWQGWVMVLVAGCSAAGIGQQVLPGEFLEATSPLRTGGMVTTRSVPGAGISTQISPQLGGGGGGSSLGSPSLNPLVAGGGSSSGPWTGAQVARLPSSGFAANPAVPATGLPPVQGGSGSLAGGAVMDPYAMAGGGVGSVWQLPTLGYTPWSRYRSTAGRSSFLPAGGAAGLPPVGPPPASLPPALGGGEGVAGALPSPQMFAPAATSAPSSLQPLVRFQNMPPGSYLGQGLVGQPKAYVDGQPVRNLLRYIFP